MHFFTEVQHQFFIQHIQFIHFLIVFTCKKLHLNFQLQFLKPWNCPHVDLALLTAKIKKTFKLKAYFFLIINCFIITLKST